MGFLILFLLLQLPLCPTTVKKHFGGQALLFAGGCDAPGGYRHMRRCVNARLHACLRMCVCVSSSVLHGLMCICSRARRCLFCAWARQCSEVGASAVALPRRLAQRAIPARASLEFGSKGELPPPLGIMSRWSNLRFCVRFLVVGAAVSMALARRICLSRFLLGCAASHLLARVFASSLLLQAPSPIC